MTPRALGTRRAWLGLGLAAVLWVRVGCMPARARGLATLPPRTVKLDRDGAGCVLLSRVARSAQAQSQATGVLLRYTLVLLGWCRGVWDMEGMAQGCPSRSPLPTKVSVEGAPMLAC